jgi:NTE family protein
LERSVKSVSEVFSSVEGIGLEVNPPTESRIAQSDDGIGLALGGGFARGIAHIGVLKVLESENIPIRCIAGTSVGALIGAAYCSGVSTQELERVSGHVRFKHIARWTLSRYGFASSQRMIGFLNSLLKVKTFEELRIPLTVTTTNFATGEGVLFSSGPLIDPVRASCAYPGMFQPVKIEGNLLIDGMLSHTVPTQPLRQMGAKKVLAVHLKGRWTNGGEPRHLFDVIGQCFAIAQEMNSGRWRPAADLIIEPNVSAYKYDAFECAADMIRAGEQAAQAAMPVIRTWIKATADWTDFTDL